MIFELVNPAPLPPVAADRRRYRGQRGAFALVITLLILSLLIVVAVSYLSSMISERQTADAYTSKARAEQVAQSGVDSAMAILTESFRDFPDSATAWDVQQSPNGGTSPNPAIVSTPFNEGTSLYLRAVPTQGSFGSGAAGSPAVVADPHPNSTSALASDASGNNPNNPACENFVLPLISGVPGGRARLVTEKSAMFAAMNLAEADPAKQNFTDLNVRRSSFDTQGAIGSPPDWTGVGPKPARAYWVNLTGSDGRITGRYAFWIEDESFRANLNFIGTQGQKAGTGRIDNTAQPQTAGTARPLAPGDVSLPGFLSAIQNLASNAAIGALSSDGNAKILLDTRAAYAGSFFPDPLAFTHSTTTGNGTPDAALKPLLDALRYTTTTQSGALNFTRHGTQRLNLNGILPRPTGQTDPEKPQPAAVTQSAVDQIVNTLKFHLPNFGQRFYRTSTDTSSATLNAKQVVATGTISDPATIYLYKIAANLCDYLDTDSQPTMILAGGTVDDAPPTGPLNDDQSNNTYWAQGKESAPFIQEVVVRNRPVVATDDGPLKVDPPMKPRDFDIQVDYYIEFWNMSDRDIYAAPQPAPNDHAPHLNAASVFVRDQQAWTPYTFNNDTHTGDVFVRNAYTTELLYSNGHHPDDWQIDLASSLPLQPVKRYDPATGGFVAQDGSNGVPKGVVFQAGAVTIITTDPDCYNPAYAYKYISPYSDDYDSPVPRAANVFLCPLLSGTRDYKGHIQTPTGLDAVYDGVMLIGSGPTPKVSSGTEVSLANTSGYLDVARGAITKVKTSSTPMVNYFYTITWKSVRSPPTSYSGTDWHNDYSFGGALMGNVAEGSRPKSATGVIETATPSELGDPRTNNEQLAIDIDPGGSSTANNPDGSHYMPGTRTLGVRNWATVTPNLTSAAMSWGDYFAMPLPTAANPYPDPGAANAPVVIADAPLTSIGQLGDVYDPARIQGAGGILYSRGGGRTLKIGQHDDRYSFDPTGNASNKTVDNVSASNRWAAWRLADVFSIDDNQEMPGRININGVARDQGAALLAALDGWTFQPPTGSGASPADPTIHGDGHSDTGLAGQPLDTSKGSAHGAAQLIRQMLARLNTAPVAGQTPATPFGPFFERGEFGELGTATAPLFGTNSATAVNTTLVNNVDMNTTFDHGREEMFRRLSELICTRGDTFTVYTVGQSIFQAPITNAAHPPPLRVTGSHRLRVTFRLIPKDANGNVFVPTPFDGSRLDSNPISGQVNKRFAQPDHYDAQPLAVGTF